MKIGIFLEGSPRMGGGFFQSLALPKPPAAPKASAIPRSFSQSPNFEIKCHNLYPKFKKGAECFIMIADPDKYIDQNGQYKLMTSAGFVDWGLFVDDYDGGPVKGRWYFYGIDRFCALLNKDHYNNDNNILLI